MTRFTVNGDLDEMFGVGGADGDGRVITDFGSSGDEWNDTPYQIAIHGDGVVVAGISVPHAIGPAGRNYDAVIARYNADGTLDTDFGDQGMVRGDFGGYEYGYGLAIDANDKILLGGRRGAVDLVARYNVDGSLDDGTANDTTPGDSFGPLGWVEGDLNGTIMCLAVTTDGTILGGGHSLFGPPDSGGTSASSATWPTAASTRVSALAVWTAMAL